MEAVFRPQTLSETRGFMKVLIHAHSDRIFGVAALGPEAGELMTNVQVAMLAGVPYTLLRDAVFTHPTMTEVWECYLPACPNDATRLSRNADTRQSINNERRQNE